MEFLCFIRYIGSEYDGLNDYQFYFTDNTEEFWGDGFDVVPAGICNNLMPYDGTYNKVVKYHLNITLDLAQDNTSFSFQDVKDGILALGFESLEGYEQYPENGRMVLHFGETIEEVEKKLGLRKESDGEDTK